MALTTLPTAAEIKARIIADIENEINQTTPSFPKAFTRVLAGAMSGVILLLYQLGLWLYKQIFPDTADDASVVLLGQLVNITRLPAVASIITATVGGTIGEAASEGTLFLGGNSVVYKITTGGIVGGSGLATVTMTSQETGEIGNLANGSILNIISPDPVLTGTATVTATTTEGDDKESLDSFRSRVSAGYKKRRTGGSPADYEAWGLETPNFDWISPVSDPNTPGKILLYGRVDNQTDGIPIQSQLDALEVMVLQDPVTGKHNRQPIGDEVEALPISRFSFDITISIQNGTTAIKDNIESGVESYVENQQPYNEGVSLTRNDTISESGISNIASDIAIPAGAAITSVELVQTSPVLAITSYQLFGGEWGKVNSISWVDVV